jgi:hypothetical protein
MHRGATWTQAFLLTGLVLWPLITVLTFVMRAKSKRSGKTASRLGWDPTSANLWCGVEAMPVNASAGPSVMTSMHGMWRGHLSESTTLGPGRRGSFTFSRVELMELSGSLPLLEIIRRGKNAAARASGDDDFEVGSTEFDKNFRVVAPNREFARAVLHPRMVKRLLQEDARELSLTIVGARIMVWSVPPATLDDLEARLNVMADVIDLIPEDAYTRWESAPVVMPSDSKKKNWMARVAVVLSYSFFLTPVGIILGHRALRASRRGLATNGRTALIAVMGGYLVLVMTVIFMVAAWISDHPL